MPSDKYCTYQGINVVTGVEPSRVCLQDLYLYNIIVLYSVVVVMIFSLY